MTQHGKDTDTSTTEGPSRPIAKPQPPTPAQHDHESAGDGKHEIDPPGERADDEADPGQKRVTRQE